MKWFFLSLVMILVGACAPQNSDEIRESDTMSPEPETETPVPGEDGIAIQGMFRYMADAALFQDCRTGKTFPVAMAGPYIDLETAYLNSGIEPGKALKVSLRGRYLERPAMEGNTNEVMLIVDIFQGISDSQDCQPSVHAELINTYWKLVEINGTAFRPSQGSRDTHLILSTDESRVHGFAGCNNFFGTYQNNGEHLSFSPLGSTRMACPDGMEAEQAFLKALDQVDRAVVSGMFLEVFYLNQKLARFEAIYLP